jgi:hypothetical protein
LYWVVLYWVVLYWVVLYWVVLYLLYHACMYCLVPCLTNQWDPYIPNMQILSLYQRRCCWNLSISLNMECCVEGGYKMIVDNGSKFVCNLKMNLGLFLEFESWWSFDCQSTLHLTHSVQHVLYSWYPKNIKISLKKSKNV